jgi:predicted DNA-binding transcriptional regulator AlpA
MARIEHDFRQTFARMAPQAVISRVELASLLSTSEGAISQMVYRGELPQTAFPGKRRSCWFVADIRAWLDSLSRPAEKLSTSAASLPKKGRPRLSTAGTE